MRDDRSARLPKTKPNAPNRIDFPAPVSPVITENPSENLTDNFSIKAKFSMDKDTIMVVYYCLILTHFVELVGEILDNLSTNPSIETTGPPEKIDTISSAFASKKILVK